jgi:hypothetical protein
LPAEEDVAGGLHQLLAGDDTFALVVVFALAGVAGQHRWLGLLGLQQQRSEAVVGFHQQDPRLGADAADADDLAGHTGQGEPLCQRAPVGRQSPGVPSEQAAQEPVDGVDVKVAGIPAPTLYHRWLGWHAPPPCGVPSPCSSPG